MREPGIVSCRLFYCGLAGSLIILCLSFVTSAQSNGSGEQFGPVVRGYLGYLRNEQEVVDDRASRHEVSVSYYHRNSNRIRALRQMAIQIANQSHNDYLPELEAVTAGELGLLFERPPRSQTLRIGEVLQTTFRYLGAVRTGESFFIFARLDPYEQAELMQKANHNVNNAANSGETAPSSGPKAMTRARRVTTP